ncbi:helix-turn-helix domain-containing protein [Qingshengfaniella alkalisoli]|uniref:HTH DNA binding domain-containing protein n=1 Tax=Qingshengfaniella alkalisoli TaxID=2599296 RepID=A0A5B8J3L3_9RHOB|nr:helix-turn-helix domain-containing protein [Qingshengfaniella alkalisoli]QDY71298.1 hypothetical protein FPZ52_16075 [Qingshengfaniella alkalisoli]
MQEDNPEYAPRSIFDREQTEEDDLWFVPPPPDGDSAPTDLPWKAVQPSDDLLRPSGWARAQSALAMELAGAAMAYGALDERLRQAPEGWRMRIILMEVADLGWHLGDRIGADRLALYMATRLSGASDDAQALARAAWAVRRLEGRMELNRRTLAGFIGRERSEQTEHPDLIMRPTGDDFGSLAADWFAVFDDAPDLHPLTRSALAWHAWRRHALSGDEAELEGAVVAARLGAEDVRQRDGGLGFVPAAMSGSGAHRVSGGVRQRLSAWYTGIERACLRGLMECDRVAEWTERATKATSDLSGRTPPQLVEALARWPLVSAPMLEARTKASRAAVQRNMLLFEKRGLVREVTGQERFRYWSISA